jgi:hypothetical protein
VTQTLALAVLSTLLGVAVAGCGGSKPPSVASLGTTTSNGGAASTSGAGTGNSGSPSAAALAACFSSHGFAASVGSTSAAPSRALKIAGVTISGNVNPESTQFQAAMQACRKFLPGGGPPALTPAQQAEAAQAMLSFAACMRKHGVPDFPDPNGQGRFPLGMIGKLGSNPAALATAYNSCKSLEPKFGPRIVFGKG